MIKTCAVCLKKVYKGTGTYYRKVLIHKWCKSLSKATPWRFNREKNKEREEELTTGTK